MKTLLHVITEDRRNSKNITIFLCEKKRKKFSEGNICAFDDFLLGLPLHTQNPPFTLTFKMSTAVGFSSEKWEQ